MSKLISVLLGFTFSLSLLVSCSKDSDNAREVVLNISPTISYTAPRPPAVGDADIPAMKVVENGKTDTILLTLDRIEGFTFTEGYKYQIKVRISTIENPPADGYSDNYKLLEMLYKE